MIPTYHCGKYLPQTLSSVLAQDLGPKKMQIEVIDDCSTEDDPQSIVEELGRGRIGFFRQPRNVGHVKNFEACLQRARGRLVHLLHGDDYVMPGFYSALQRGFEHMPAIGAAFCRHIFADESGEQLSISPLEQPASGLLANSLERLAVEQRIMTPSMVVRRDVYEHVGGFDSRLTCSEDWEMWVRIAAFYPIWYEVQPLAAYRMHLHSNTGRHVRTGEDILFTCAAIEMFRQYLPSATARRVVPRAKRTYALAALNMANNLAMKQDWRSMRAQVSAALQCSRSVLVWIGIVRLAAQCGCHWLKGIQRGRRPPVAKSKVGNCSPNGH